MTPEPTLSIVVPFRNVGPYLEHLAHSVTEQQMSDFEAILVADAPEDDSLYIAHRIAAADPRFRIVEAGGVGPGPARNLGAQEARGEFLAFADGDDLVTARGYLRMVTSLRTTGSSFVASNALRFSDDGRVWQSWTHGRSFGADSPRTHITRRPDLVGDRMVWNKVFRRDFWESAELTFPAHLYEDIPVCLAAHLAADTVDLLSDHSYMWRERGRLDSITQSFLHPGNAVDRVRAVTSALELTAPWPSQVRNAFESYARQIDLPAIAAIPSEALGPAGEQARDDLLAVLMPVERDADSTPRIHPPAPPVTARWDEDEVIVETREGVVTSLVVSATGAIADEDGHMVRQVATSRRGQAVAAATSHLAGAVEGLSPAPTLMAFVEREEGTGGMVPVLASASLPPAIVHGNSAVVWGAFARGEFSARVVEKSQTASFALTSTGLHVTLGSADVGGDVEIRIDTRTRPLRSPVIDGRALFRLAHLVECFVAADPVRQRSEGVLFHDRAGLISQLYPVALSGRVEKSGLILTLERTSQGAALLRRTRAQGIER